VQGGDKIVFNRYRKHELVKITESKIGFEVVDKKALDFVAAKVAASSGDARRYLELVTLAINRCLEHLPQTKMQSPLTKPVVTIRDMMLAIRETNFKYKDVIEGLTTFEKVTLCAGTHLSRKFDGKPLTMKSLMDLTMECYGIHNDLDIEDFKGVMERLQDSGLLLLTEEDKRKLKQGMSIQELCRCLIRFEMQLEDVESAIDETLMKESFYQNLVERVKSLKC
jgi:Cdc6-like AAA superfamily ATPase